MTLFLFFMLSTLFAGWLARRQTATFRLALALFIAIALAALYFTLDRFI
jgi:hypothetical protein